MILLSHFSNLENKDNAYPSELLQGLNNADKLFSIECDTKYKGNISPSFFPILL